MTPDPERSITGESISNDTDLTGDTMTWWESLEQWRATLFLVGGLILLLDVLPVVANIRTGAADWLILGQTFVGAGWTATLVGLLGLYPEFSDRSRWLSRVGAVFAVIGVVTFGVMAITSLLYYVGIPSGDYDAISWFFLPGVLIGSVLGFVTFSTISLRTGIPSRTVGVLLLVPAILVVTNILRFIVGMESATITLGIVIGDALAMLAIGYVLRTEGVPTDSAEPTPAEVRHD